MRWHPIRLDPIDTCGRGEVPDRQLHLRRRGADKESDGTKIHGQVPRGKAGGAETRLASNLEVEGREVERELSLRALR